MSNEPEIRDRDLTKGRGLTWIRGLPWVRLLTWLYWASAAGLAPWIIVLFLTQVRRGQAHQVHILTVGLVLAMMLGLLATAWLYSRDSWLSVMAASFTATVTFISAWFRILTQTGTSESAGLTAVFLVIVTAIIVLCVVTIRVKLARTATHARWLTIALTIAALALVPSVVIVLDARPGVQIATHLRLAWTGLDVFELLALAHTGSALHRRSVTVVVPATITGALLLCDAWINVIATHAAAQAEGIALAFVEVPMAALSFWVATRAMSYPAADRLGLGGQTTSLGRCSMAFPDVVSREQWLAARKLLLAQEKEQTRRQDALNAQRRRLPMVRVEKEYVFGGPRGAVTLAGMFGGCRQLIVHHIMFGPDWDEPCPSCRNFMDELSAGLIAHLHDRDTAFALVSRAPRAKIEAYQASRGWAADGTGEAPVGLAATWYSSYGSDFNYDFEVTLDESRAQYNYRAEPGLLGGQASTEMPGTSCFLRDGEAVFHTYSAFGRGNEYIPSLYTLLDLTALGRQEGWEEPKGRAPVLHD